MEFQCEINSKEATQKITLLKSIVQQIDKGILLGAPFPNVSDLLPQIASKLNHTSKYYIKTKINVNNLNLYVIYNYIVFLYYNFDVIFAVESSKALNFEKLNIKSEDLHDMELLSRFTEIKHYDEPSMELFYRDMFKPKVPAILTGNILLINVQKIYLMFFISMFILVFLHRKSK